DGDTTYAWPTAFTKITTLNSAGFAGHTDWRLPNVVELQSLMDYRDGISPAFNTGCVPGCSVLTCSCTREAYWTSTTTAHSRRDAWGAGFQDGTLVRQAKATRLAVRAVRGGA